ncbi:MAG: hypothetical protein HY982_02955 [Candidatus Magasanikbacteria bacterium]|nr:hypothetical protein [Candidatus Magasanikbacteria bacterium]
MNKKAKTIVVVVLAVVVVGGVYFGINRWRQQRLANQILKGVYGLDTGILGKLTGGGTVPEQVAKEIAKQAAKEEAQQKTDEAKEAAKTPEDRYNETEEMATYDANSKAIANDAKEIIEKAFGKAKLTTISTGMYGSGAAGSGVVEFKIARLTTGADLGALNKSFTDKGFNIMQSGIEDKNAGVMAGNDNVVYTVNFDIGG